MVAIYADRPSLSGLRTLAKMLPLPHWYHRIVMVGDTGPDVRAIRTVLNLAPEGAYDERCAALVRGRQRMHSMPTDGHVGPQTARILGEPADYGQVPLWWQGRNLHYGVKGQDVSEMGLRIDFWMGDTFGQSYENAVRRWESAHGHKPTGVFTEQYAIEVGD